MNKQFDYIIAGAGASGLSLLMYLMEYADFKNKSVLLMDKDDKKKNDRTWCFWQKEESPFEAIVHRSWQKLFFHSSSFSELLDISPYTYKMVRGIDFYEYCFERISKYKNITFLQAEITEIRENGEVVAGKTTFQADYVFNSAFVNIPKQENKHYLLQHFKGWMIKTEEDSFDIERPILMDFRISQKEGCSFMYVFPMSANQAFVEYTLFTEKILEQESYDTELRKYLSEIAQVAEYEIVDTEFGIIPMTNAPIKTKISEKVINIGTAGGYTKASTGYTFAFMQKYCKQIAENLMNGKLPVIHHASSQGKYGFYDSVLLRVLAEKKHPAQQVFTDLFKKLPTPLILDFLDENSTLIQDLRLMNSVHKPTFIKAAFKEILN